MSAAVCHSARIGEPFMTPFRTDNPAATISRRTSVSAFTIVELLVVIAIIGVLVGLVVPAISGVQKRSKKTAELNNIKHLGHAWALYANNNNDACLPGYLD